MPALPESAAATPAIRRRLSRRLRLARSAGGRSPHGPAGSAARFRRHLSAAHLAKRSALESALGAIFRLFRLLPAGLAAPLSRLADAREYGLGLRPVLFVCLGNDSAPVDARYQRGR